MVFILSALWCIWIKGIWDLPDGRDWLWGNLVLVLIGGTMLSISLIQFFVGEWGCVPFLLFSWRQTMVEVMVIMETYFKRTSACTVVLNVPDSTAGHCWPMLSPETLGHTHAGLAQSPVGTLLLSLGSWWAQGVVYALQESLSPVQQKFCNQIPLASKVKVPGSSQSFCRIPRLGNLL